MPLRLAPIRRFDPTRTEPVRQQQRELGGAPRVSRGRVLHHAMCDLAGQGQSLIELARVAGQEGEFTRLVFVEREIRLRSKRQHTVRNVHARLK